MKKITHTCPVCKKVFHGRRDRKYCSIKCRVTQFVPWNKGRTGIKANRPKTGEYRTCQHCNKEFYKKSYSKYGYFCSMKCYAESRNEIRECAVCGNKFSVRKSDTKTTCSKKCLHQRRLDTHQGEKSHLWRGGKMAPYVESWRDQRRKALERDGYKCVICKSTDRLNVHHKIPYRYSHSHDLDNLVTLCRSCHSREEILVNKASQAGLLARWKKIQAGK